MVFKVPVREVQVQGVGPAPISEQSINAPEAAFGGATARALQGVGQSLGQAAQAAGNVAIEQQDRQDTSIAIDNYNKFRDEWRLKDSEFKKREGIDSFGVTQSATTEFDKMAQKFGDDLDEGAQRRFLALTQQSRNSSLNGMAKFEQLQSKNAFNNQMQAITNTAINDGVEDFTNPQTTKQSESVINTAVRGMLKGQSQEVIDAAIQNQNTLLHGGIVDRISETDPDAAEAYLEANKDKMNADSVTKLQKGLNVKLAAERSEEIVAEHYNSDDTIDEVIKDIRKAGKGKPQAIVDDAVSRAKARRNADNAADKERNEAAFATIWESVKEGGSVDGAPNELLSEMSPEQISKLEDERLRVANNNPTVTNSKTWQDIMTMDPAVLAEQNIYEEYGSKLSQPDFQRALNLQVAAKATVSGADKTVAQVREGDYSAALRLVASQAGLISAKSTFTKLRQGDDSKSRRFQAFDRNLREEVDTWYANNKGKKLSRTELTEIGNRLIVDTVYVSEFGRDPQLPISALTPDDIENAYFEGDVIRPEVRDSFLLAFPNRRTRLTRDDVADIMLDVQLGRPVDKVSASDIPQDQLTKIAAAYEQRGIRFNDDAERDQAFVDLYLKGIFNALR